MYVHVVPQEYNQGMAHLVHIQNDHKDKMWSWP